MDNKFNAAVMMGRMQPPHAGHIKNILKAAEIAPVVIILLGGADKPRTAKNPFTIRERRRMILASLPEEVKANCRISVHGMHDHPYSDEEWVREVKNLVYSNTSRHSRVALVGHHKDDSSYYLDLFPEWSMLEVENYNNIDATKIRDVFFSHPYVNVLDSGLTEATKAFLHEFSETGDYTNLAAEHMYIKQYKDSWSKSPFPPVFSTVDTAVLCSNNLMVIKRGRRPSKGLLALPGGYSDVKERLVVSAKRELEEETGLKFTLDSFTTRLLGVKTFDHPTRSQIGRVITQLHVINGDGLYLQRFAKAGDDAAEVIWLTHADTVQNRSRFSSDHWEMAMYAFDMYRGGTK